ncbi:MAG: glycosyltransferase [Thermoguttaceae bacterium]|jgi:hypothetical protein
MKVLALIESADHVCFRYRLSALAWSMAQEGLFLEALPLSKHLPARLGQFVRAGRADLVILQRRLLPRWQLLVLRRLCRRLVYDVDDALFFRDSFSTGGALSPMRLARFRLAVRVADAVLAGNEYLRQYAAAYTDPGRVHHVPTCVEPRWYPPAAHCRTGAAVRLAWIGQRAMLPSLGCIREHLGAVAKALPGIDLRLICDTAPPSLGVRLSLRPWSAEAEADELAEADIGISWLPDDLWSLGKCGLKVLQYMAAGLPVVANPVGIHHRLVIDGRTGFLASTPAEWTAAVARLAADPALRNQMGAAARQRVVEHYSVQHWGPRLAAILAPIALRSPHTPCAESGTRSVPAA